MRRLEEKRNAFSKMNRGIGLIAEESWGIIKKGSQMNAFQLEIWKGGYQYIVWYYH